MSNQNGNERYNKEENNFNLVSEIDAAAGVEVSLKDVILEPVNDDIFSGDWVSGDVAAANKPASPSFSVSSDSNNYKSDNVNFDDRNDTDNADFDIDSLADKTNRERVENAISGEEKKGFNPRIIKLVVGGLAALLLIGFVVIGMTGEKRKSYLGKTDKSETETAADENSAGTDPAQNQNEEKRPNNMNFGEMTVGSDPNADYSGNNTSDMSDTNATETNAATSTEEAKRNETYDPYNTSNGGNSSYEFTPTNSRTTGGGVETNPAQTVNAGGTTAADLSNGADSQTSESRKKRKKGALTEEDLNMESNEVRFGSTLRAGRATSDSGIARNTVEQTNALNKITTSGQAEGINPELRRGEKLELYLEEPIRSGIATSVTARLKKGIKNRNGKLIFPKDSLAIIQINAVTVNGRIFNEQDAPIYIVTPDGQNYEISGAVKDQQGYAGLTGKVKKIGGRGTLGTLGGILSRVGSVIPGADRVSRIPGEIGGNSGYAANPTEIVEINKGTSFIVVIG